MPSINIRLQVAKSVGLPLVELEKKLDDALCIAAEVFAAAVKGRREARLPLDAGEGALAGIAAASEQLLAACREIHAAHYGLREMGLPTIGDGDHGDTPDGFAQTRGEAPAPALVVSNAA